MRLTVTMFAALLAFQANAQTENKLSIAARAWASVENVSTTGAPGTTPNVRQRFRLTNDSSFIRLRGDLKLTSDLSAWGQIETQFAIDGIGATGATNVPFDLTRETGVGFTSKALGTIMGGRWGSPYKLATIGLDPWADTGILNYAAILGQFPRITTGNIYDARLSNNVQYWSPVVGGLQVKAAVETNEDKTADINPWVFSASASYTGAPLYLTAAYETRKDCGAGAGGTAAPTCTGALLGTHGRDWGLRLGAGFNFKPTATQVGAVFERLDSQADAATGSRTFRRNAGYVSLVQGIPGTGHEIAAGLGIAGKASGNASPAPAGTNDKTGALFYTVAYRYNFTKDLMSYVGYIQIRNDDNAQYRFGASGFVGASAIQPVGANVNGWVLGTRYLF